jgi:hypothetical protein
LGFESHRARQTLCAPAVDLHIVTSAPDLRAVTDRNRIPITIVYRTLRSANRSERTVQNYIESVALLSAFRPGTVRPLFAQPRRYRAQVATIDDVARIVAGAYPR